VSLDITMPRLSDSMEEATIVRWLKDPGSSIAAGEPLAEVETDKATMTYEAEADGVLLEIVVPEGETARLGAVIARIGAAGESATANGHGGNGAHGPAPAASDAVTVGRNGPTGDRVKASPVARRLARELGVDIGSLTGSGPRDRVVKADVLAAAAAPEPSAGAPTRADAAVPAPASEPEPAPARVAPAAVPARAPVSAGPPTPETDATAVALTRLQQVVARRMSESKATIPDFTLFADVDMTACVELRTRLKAIADPAPSYNDMVVKAAALALREVPRANGSYRDGAFKLHGRVNVGIAVAAEDALVVPAVSDADTRSLGDIARETRRLAAAVRDGSITPPDLAGGTFTISNLGMYGVRAFSAIVNPPQAGILSVGEMAKRAVVADDDAIVARQMLTLGLVCDHRILYGAEAARFLARIRQLLEQPLSMAL
jgi:pyruvate dehydrogenase E2 component (dihydrolipoamide acetyltransferase)